MEVATRLRAEARAANERRLLVFAGKADSTRKQARVALESADIASENTTYVGPADSFSWKSLSPHEVDKLLGTSREAVVYDCHERCEPNALGKLVGTVVGGGLLILLTPPLSTWPRARDKFDRSLAVPPFSVSEVGTNFRRRLIETLREHRGVAIVDADTGAVERDGLCHLPARRPRNAPTLPDNPAFPTAAYDACLTQGQVRAVEAFEQLRDEETAVVVEADRGRGKSSAAGLAAGSLAQIGQDVLVTAPEPAAVEALFARARELLGVEASPGTDTIEVGKGRIRYERPADAAALPDDPDTVFVDEAAAISVRLLTALLDARALGFTTTVHGYEGTGRGFDIRFRERLDESRFAVTDVQLREPIRYAPADPIEVWAFRALALDARPPVAQLVAETTPQDVTYRQFSSEQLCADEQLLREVFGLLVLAHYRTEPNDLARLLDAPNVSVHGLVKDGHVVAVALCSREGGLSAEQRTAVYEGERIRGNLIPDVLTSQLRDETAGEGVGLRVMRIATHAAVRSRGLGSHLLAKVRDHATEKGVDWLGVAYGATPRLVEFWASNKYQTVHLSTTRNDRSGEHSAIMLQPLTERGKQLHERHTEWFLRRTPATLGESLSDVDPAIIRAVCRSAGGKPSLLLSEQEWRHAAGVPHGKALFETAPLAIRRLTFRHLVAPETDKLSPRQERLLIQKALQGRSWKAVSEKEQFHTEANCMRTLGQAVEPLVDCYGPETARDELKRYR